MFIPGTFVRFSFTCPTEIISSTLVSHSVPTERSRPRNMLSFNIIAFCTIDGSENSTYAYLQTHQLWPRSISCHGGSRQGKSKADTDPFGCPVNLSHSIVTRLIVPHAWKCACISSGVAP